MEEANKKITRLQGDLILPTISLNNFIFNTWISTDIYRSATQKLSDSEKEIQRLKDEKEREIEKRLSDTMESHYKATELLKSDHIKQVCHFRLSAFSVSEFDWIF